MTSLSNISHISYQEAYFKKRYQVQLLYFSYIINCTNRECKMLIRDEILGAVTAQNHGTKEAAQEIKQHLIIYSSIIPALLK